jgi:hypothetical protein
VPDSAQATGSSGGQQPEQQSVLGFPVRPEGDGGAVAAGRHHWYELAQEVHGAFADIDRAIASMQWSGDGRRAFDTAWSQLSGHGTEAAQHSLGGSSAGMDQQTVQNALAAEHGSEPVDALRRDFPRLRDSELATLSRLCTQPDYESHIFRQSEHVGAEVVDEVGRSYDFLGQPAASKYWNQEEFLGSITDHLRKSNDFTVVDLAGFSPPHAHAVQSFVNALPEVDRARLVILGP